MLIANKETLKKQINIAFGLSETCSIEELKREFKNLWAVLQWEYKEKYGKYYMNYKTYIKEKE